MENFHKIESSQLSKDAITLIGKDWMLISASKDGVANTMTAAWGGLGYLWNKPVAFLFIRPQRYTKEFVEASDALSLTFFDEEHREALRYLGRVSGKDEDKIKKVNFHTKWHNEIPYFEEATITIFATKLYKQEIDPACFIDQKIIDERYPLRDFHTVYVVEIDEIYARDDA